LGQSGADVYDLDESLILKHVVRERIDNGMFDTYVKEALFYQAECPKPCDWQGVGVCGASADLSFFMSRLSADELERHMKAANVITSFRFWHYYLHGNDTERVRGIYDKMISDYQALK
jgi:hypothetical protein